MSYDCNNDNNLCQFIPKCLEYTVCTKKLYFWKHKPESVIWNYSKNNNSYTLLNAY